MIAETLIEAKTSQSRQWMRITDLFLAPDRLFKDVLQNKSWWLPFLLTVVCNCMLTFSAAHQVGFHQMTENVIRADPTSASRFDDDMTPPQREATLNTTETMLRVSAFSTPILILLYNAIYGLALWFGLNILLGGHADFGSVFTVLLYADLIQNLRSILATVILYISPDPSNFNLQNTLGTNVGYYIGSGYAGWLRTLLETMDIITIWYLVLISLGCAVVAKVSRSSSAGVVFGFWLMIVMSRVIWAAIT